MDWKGIILFLKQKALGKSNKRITLSLKFVVEPEMFYDCPYFEKYSDALAMAKREDEFKANYRGK